MEKNDKINLLNQLVIVVGMISIFIAILLLLNFWNTKKTDPLESEVLTALVDRLKAEPINETLMVEIRNLDLLARKAYFTSHWQSRTGGFLLLFSSIILVFLLKALYEMKKKIEPPEGETDTGMMVRILSRRWIGVIGFIVIVGAILASFMSKDYLEQYDMVSDIGDTEQDTDDNIEMIEITSLGNVAPQDTGTIVYPDQQTINSAAEKVTVETSPNQENPAIALGKKQTASSAGNYPNLSEIRKQHNSFRGLLSQGISYHKNIPVSWDGTTGENILWKAEIPKDGNNSPIIWGDKIFLAGADQQSREVYCYNRNSGEMLWKHEASGIEGSPVVAPETKMGTGLSAPTLTTDGQRIYAIFATGDILALDMKGQRVWAKNLGVPDNHYGHSSSLICWKEKLIVQYDTRATGRLLAINVLDGTILWDVLRAVKVSWTSPVLGEIDGKYQVFTVSEPLVVGHDLETGKIYWSVDCMMGEIGPSVAFSGGIVFAAQDMDKLVAIKPGIGGGEILWEEYGDLPDASSPLVTNGLLFLATSSGIVVCHDAQTGELLWDHLCDNGFYGSPMAADGKVYIMDKEGVCHIYEINRELNLIGEPSLGERSFVTPALADGRIYLRGEKYLYCIGEV